MTFLKIFMFCNCKSGFHLLLELEYIMFSFTLSQISNALTGTERKELMRKLPKFIYDEEKALEVSSVCCYLFHPTGLSYKESLPCLLSSFMWRHKNCHSLYIWK